MSFVVSMLGNEVPLPQAKQPGFSTERDVFYAQSITTNAAYSDVPVHCDRGQTTGNAGIGGVLRNHQGGWIGGFKAYIGCCTTFQAELKGILKGLHIA
ncbi:hypothetical protein BUALT_Bualt03G0128000 [Buddleja alternifolia]|uniref:RNase H type-1 domain-containing protein n=1 Tax=Buddleja alternifolia TaxID=168488 RepID=A0AAV6Y1N3_9LAMI|nr:hypothetical protein BUALT_Bualt03G0128000 [Buddleja alternifolia]